MDRLVRPNHVIIKIPLPQSTPESPEKWERRLLLETRHKFAQVRIIRLPLDENVQMVRHHAPKHAIEIPALSQWREAAPRSTPQAQPVQSTAPAHTCKSSQKTTCAQSKDSKAIGVVFAAPQRKPIEANQRSPQDRLRRYFLQTRHSPVGPAIYAGPLRARFRCSPYLRIPLHLINENPRQAAIAPRIRITPGPA